MVRLNRTISDCIFTGERRREGALCTTWKRFKHIEPHRTFSNYISTELARYRDFFYMSSGWFDWTEHSQQSALTCTMLLAIGKCALIGTAFPAGVARCEGCFCTSSGGSSTLNLHEQHLHRFSKVCRVLSALVQGGSSTANLHEPHHHSEQGV